MQNSLPAGGLRLYREGVEPSGSLRKVSGYIALLLSRISPDARVVYAKRPFAGPEAVLAYLARYTHRVAISNSRLIALDGNGVTFRWKDYRARGKTIEAGIIRDQQPDRIKPQRHDEGDKLVGSRCYRDRVWQVLR